MQAKARNLVDLENRFWASMRDQDTDTALSLLDEPALMISSHGAMKFDHAGYRKMAEKGTMRVKDYDLSDMQVHFASDDTAVLFYKVKQVLAQRDGSDDITQEMVDSSTWVRRDGEWRCVMHTESESPS